MGQTFDPVIPILGTAQSAAKICSQGFASCCACQTGRIPFTQEDDGLSLPWQRTVFVKPPYSRTLWAWVAKARREVAEGRAGMVVALLPARPDTSYWHAHVAGHAAVYFLRGRLRFGDGGQSAPFPSAPAVWGSDPETLAALGTALPDALRAG